MRQFQVPQHAIKPLSVWLLIVIGLLMAMIVLGGMTRVTDSGLSITEWKPVTGVVPPLSEAAWQQEFQKYQQIPEYKLQNTHMDVNDFKAIYWWEWGHRLLGRAIGLVVLLPLVFFWVRGFLSTGLKVRLAGLFVLGGLQGFMGWWMVSSGLGGLGDLLDVSPYRLVAHLGLALIILAISVWTWMDLMLTSKRKGWKVSSSLLATAWVLLGLVFVQFLLGGFVAGNDGGLVANTWPLIDGALIPASYGDLLPLWRNWFEDPLITQFHHRMGAYIVLIATIFLVWKSRKEPQAELRRSIFWVGLVIVAQILLGIWTLLAVSPISLALVHQFLALVSFLVVLNVTHGGSRLQRSS